MKIISQETIKPSSPTPPHLKNHVLSLVDNYTPAIPVPFVFFYKNYNDGDINILKKSLSQCLTQYYPFPGRISSPSASHIECNDEGVEFLEVSHDSRLEDIIHMKEHDERLYKLLPNVGENFPNLVEVQLNHFTDGGVAVAVSILHKVADGFAIATFINQWAKVTRGGLLFEPNFFISSTNHNIVKLPDVVPNNTPEVKYVNRSFVFPNSKLNELKKKVMSSMGLAVMSPPLTRIEVLTSLIYKCSAATTKSGFFKPSILVYPVNMRNKIIKNDPEKAVGNIYALVVKIITDSRQIALNEVVAKLRKGKMEIEQIRDVQEIGEKYATIIPMLVGDRTPEVFWTTSLCWFPLYEVDFGWGTPVQVKYAMPKIDNKHLFLIDTPHRDGIEAIVRLPEDEMMIFQKNEELLTYLDV